MTMFTLRRWWGQNGSKVILLSITFTTIWLIRQTQGSIFMELYYQVTRPFHASRPPNLQVENAQISALQQKVLELEQQNRQLQDLVKYNQKLPRPGIAAPVIGRSADQWWQIVTVGRGSAHGVEIDSIVVGADSLVGRVIQVTPNTSRVLLISDPTSRVGALVSRSRSMGILKGQGSNQATLQFFDKLPDVKPGDVITTSNISKLFYPGLPIGRVQSIDLDRSPAPEAIIEVTAPINALEWVIISEKHNSNN